MNAMATAREIVAALISGGVRDVVLAPGSRSAPLAYAIAQAEAAGRVRVLVRVDERAAAFSALGVALATGHPVAIVTTSGTAVANLYPALAEADAAAVPLLALTADRPRELWRTGANQTTNQVAMFDNVARACLHLDADATDASAIVAEALAAARGLSSPAPGPVQLNVSFRPPLTPETGDEPAPLPEADWQAPPAPAGADIAEVLADLEAPVVVAGDKADHIAGLAKAITATATPVFAEPSSNLRDLPSALTSYVALLAESPLAAEISDVVIAGHPTLTRPVTELISRRDPAPIVLAAHDRYTDLTGGAARVVRVAAGEPGARGELPQLPESPWLTAWLAADRAVAARPTTPLERAALTVWQDSARQGLDLLVGSSSTIRALDRFAPAREQHAGLRVWANRGLAGIDGTIATGWGLALGSGRPVRIVCGDLTFFHDASALLRGTLEAGVDLQVIVLNDAGGSIFAGLEHGELAATSEAGARRFARYFATEQTGSIGGLAAAYGAGFTRCREEGLAPLLAAGVSGLTVIEVEVSANLQDR